MKITKILSMALALALQVLPITRVFIAASPATGSSFAMVFTWIAGAVALLGSYDAVSGASTIITSAATARATNGMPFSYRITTGPHGANRFAAAPLPSGLTVSTTVGRITGTPAVEGVFTIRLTASDGGRANRTVTKNLTLTIAAAGEAPPPAPDMARPVLKVLQPIASFTRVLSNSVTIRGTAQDNQSVARVQVQQGTNAFATVTGTTTWTADVALAPGTNVLRIWATDASGNQSLTNMKTVFFAVMAPLPLTTIGNGAVSSLTNNQMLELGKRYALKAAPMPGNLFSNWVVGGQPVTGPALNFIMSSNLTVVANFVPNPFPGLKGAYSGLFYPATSEPPHEQSGYFTLTVTDKGAYTGKLLLNGGAFPISGAFGLDLSAQKTIRRVGTNELYVGLQLAAGSDQVTGFVSNALWVSELFGYRAAFHSITNPATNLLGKYTMLLAGNENAAASPLGLGWATIAVASSGSVSIKGTLADGTLGAQTGALAANGQCAVYVNLYRGKGSLFGWLTFTNTPTNDIPGLLLWTKKGGIVGNYYPGGFTNEMLAVASRYTPPAPGSAVLGFSNSVVILEGGNLISPATNDVFLSSLNKITVTSTNTNKLVLTVSATTGLLSGSFVHPQTLKRSMIKGAVLQKQDLGGGCFLGTNQSGDVFLGRPEDLTVVIP